VSRIRFRTNHARRGRCGTGRLRSLGHGIGLTATTRARRHRRRRRRGHALVRQRRARRPFSVHWLIHQLPDPIHHRRVETGKRISLDVKAPLLNALNQLLTFQAQFFGQLVNARRQRQLLRDLIPVSQANRDLGVYSNIRVDLVRSDPGRRAVVLVFLKNPFRGWPPVFISRWSHAIRNSLQVFRGTDGLVRTIRPQGRRAQAGVIKINF
jgi:hypothetical protein